MKIQFYTKPNCALCEEAERMLHLVAEDYPLEWQTINIEEDDEIHEKYMLMIPVIEHEGQVLAYGNIGYIEVLELTEQ
ncbi:thiol-disulfide isomerase [Sporosarcina sp. P12(2017)]|uniref:glutaredoxin family protein n=1 Tax=unclassified Sporosarcina TaxID=2647733 RepID=UPI000C16A30F|nr:MULTISPECIES: glutaredoxin family protein [unclassified Sporosarcina]PIC56554.1 thiol-disulfide isomerase [Sporosarcina sp. P10]PIC60205.1 thiol-disulfide isomerase [Sporosarcina sp. P12(2017)]